MWDIAFAQATPATSGPSTLISLFPLVLIFVIFYFLLVRPQQKKGKEHRNMLAQLKKNDEVLTAGGIFGKVVALKDNEVTLEVAPNMKIRVNRPQITQLIKVEKAVGKEVKAQ